jgi:uncharacterized protein
VTRILFLALIVVVVLWWLFGRKRNDREDLPPSRSKGQADAKPAKPKQVAAPAEIVACAHCGVHLPVDETVPDDDGRVFCGEPHRLAGPR